MSRAGERGFTLPEVIIAIVLLTVGVMALAGTSAMVTRMVGRGGRTTQVGQVMATRAEWLRRVASTTTPCTSTDFKSDSATTSQVKEKWELLAAAGTGSARTFRMSFSYRNPRQIVADTFLLTLLCK